MICQLWMLAILVGNYGGSCQTLATDVSTQVSPDTSTRIMTSSTTAVIQSSIKPTRVEINSSIESFSRSTSITSYDTILMSPNLTNTDLLGSNSQFSLEGRYSLQSSQETLLPLLSTLSVSTKSIQTPSLAVSYSSGATSVYTLKRIVSNSPLQTNVDASDTQTISNSLSITSLGATTQRQITNKKTLRTSFTVTEVSSYESSYTREQLLLTSSNGYTQTHSQPSTIVSLTDARSSSVSSSRVLDTLVKSLPISTTKVIESFPTSIDNSLIYNSDLSKTTTGQSVDIYVSSSFESFTSEITNSQQSNSSSMLLSTALQSPTKTVPAISSVSDRLRQSIDSTENSVLEISLSTTTSMIHHQPTGQINTYVSAMSTTVSVQPTSSTGSFGSETYDVGLQSSDPFITRETSTTVTFVSVVSPSIVESVVLNISTSLYGVDINSSVLKQTQTNDMSVISPKPTLKSSFELESSYVAVPSYSDENTITLTEFETKSSMFTGKSTHRTGTSEYTSSPVLSSTRIESESVLDVLQTSEHISSYSSRMYIPLSELKSQYSSQVKFEPFSMTSHVSSELQSSMLTLIKPTVHPSLLSGLQTKLYDSLLDSSVTTTTYSSSLPVNGFPTSTSTLVQPSITPPISVGTSFTQNVSDKYTTSSEFVSSEELTQYTSVASALSTLESGGFTSEYVMPTLIDNDVTTMQDSKYGRTSESSVTSAAVITPSTSTFVPSISGQISIILDLPSVSNTLSTDTVEQVNTDSSFTTSTRETPAVTVSTTARINTYVDKTYLMHTTVIQSELINVSTSSVLDNTSFQMTSAPGYSSQLMFSVSPYTATTIRSSFETGLFVTTTPVYNYTSLPSISSADFETILKNISSNLISSVVTYSSDSYTERITPRTETNMYATSISTADIKYTTSLKSSFFVSEYSSSKSMDKTDIYNKVSTTDSTLDTTYRHSMNNIDTLTEAFSLYMVNSSMLLSSNTTELRSNMYTSGIDEFTSISSTETSNRSERIMSSTYDVVSNTGLYKTHAIDPSIVVTPATKSEIVSQQETTTSIDVPLSSYIISSYIISAIVYSSGIYPSLGLSETGDSSVSSIIRSLQPTESNLDTLSDSTLSQTNFISTVEIPISSSSIQLETTSQPGNSMSITVTPSESSSPTVLQSTQSSEETFVLTQTAESSVWNIAQSLESSSILRFTSVFTSHKTEMLPTVTASRYYPSMPLKTTFQPSEDRSIMTTPLQSSSPIIPRLTESSGKLVEHTISSLTTYIVITTTSDTESRIGPTDSHMPDTSSYDSSTRTTSSVQTPSGSIVASTQGRDSSSARSSMSSYAPISQTEATTNAIQSSDIFITNSYSSTRTIVTLPTFTSAFLMPSAYTSSYSMYRSVSAQVHSSERVTTMTSSTTDILSRPLATPSSVSSTDTPLSQTLATFSSVTSKATPTVSIASSMQSTLLAKGTPASSPTTTSMSNSGHILDTISYVIPPSLYVTSHPDSSQTQISSSLLTTTMPVFSTDVSPSLPSPISLSTTSLFSRFSEMSVSDFVSIDSIVISDMYSYKKLSSATDIISTSTLNIQSTINSSLFTSSHKTISSTATTSSNIIPSVILSAPTITPKISTSVLEKYSSVEMNTSDKLSSVTGVISISKSSINATTSYNLGPSVTPKVPIVTPTLSSGMLASESSFNVPLYTSSNEILSRFTEVISISKLSISATNRVSFLPTKIIVTERASNIPMHTTLNITPSRTQSTQVVTPTISTNLLKSESYSNVQLYTSSNEISSSTTDTMSVSKLNVSATTTDSFLTTQLTPPQRTITETSTTIPMNTTYSIIIPQTKSTHAVTSTMPTNILESESYSDVQMSTSSHEILSSVTNAMSKSKLSISATFTDSFLTAQITSPPKTITETLTTIPIHTTSRLINSQTQSAPNDTPTMSTNLLERESYSTVQMSTSSIEMSSSVTDAMSESKLSISATPTDSFLTTQVTSSEKAKTETSTTIPIHTTYSIIPSKTKSAQVVTPTMSTNMLESESYSNVNLSTSTNEISFLTTQLTSQQKTITETSTTISIHTTSRIIPSETQSAQTVTPTISITVLESDSYSNVQLYTSSTKQIPSVRSSIGATTGDRFLTTHLTSTQKVETIPLISTISIIPSITSYSQTDTLKVSTGLLKSDIYSTEQVYTTSATLIPSSVFASVSSVASVASASATSVSSSTPLTTTKIDTVSMSSGTGSKSPDVATSSLSTRTPTGSLSSTIVASSSITQSSTIDSTSSTPTTRVTVPTTETPNTTVGAATADEPYWVKTTLKVQKGTDVTSKKFKDDLELRLADAYNEAFVRQKLQAEGKFEPLQERRRKKRSTTVGLATVHIRQISREPGTTLVTATYVVANNGSVLVAPDAVESLDVMTTQELAIILHHVVDSKAESYVKLDEPTDGDKDGSQLLIIALVAGPIAGGLIIIWLLVCIYIKCCRHKGYTVEEPELTGIKEQADKEQRARTSGNPNPLFSSQNEKQSRPSNRSPTKKGRSYEVDQLVDSEQTADKEPAMTSTPLKPPSKQSHRPQPPPPTSTDGSPKKVTPKSSPQKESALVKEGRRENDPSSPRKQSKSSLPKSNIGSSHYNDDQSYEPVFPANVAETHLLQPPTAETDVELREKSRQERKKNKERLRQKRQKERESYPGKTYQPDHGTITYGGKTFDGGKPPNVFVDSGSSRKDLKPVRQDSGVSNDQLSGDETLEEARQRMHMLLDDAFTLISPRASFAAEGSRRGSAQFPRRSTTAVTNSKVHIDAPHDPTIAKGKGMNHEPTFNNPVFDSESYNDFPLETWSPYRSIDKMALISMPHLADTKLDGKKGSQPPTSKPSRRPAATFDVSESKSTGHMQDSKYTANPPKPIVLRTKELLKNVDRGFTPPSGPNIDNNDNRKYSVTGINGGVNLTGSTTSLSKPKRKGDPNRNRSSNGGKTSELVGTHRGPSINMKSDDEVGFEPTEDILLSLRNDLAILKGQYGSGGKKKTKRQSAGSMTEIV